MCHPSSATHCLTVLLQSDAVAWVLHSHATHSLGVGWSTAEHGAAIGNTRSQRDCTEG